MAISLPEMSSSEVSVEYVGTSLMTVSKIISIMTVTIIIMYEIYKKHKGKENNTIMQIKNNKQ